MPIPHPWRELHGLDIEIHFADLGPRVRGATDGSAIWLNRHLTQRERRCVLRHELEHVRRGEGTRQPSWVERVVWRDVARWLLPDIRAVGEALAWAHSLDEAADELWVDSTTLQARLDHLHPAERAYLKKRLEQDHE